MPKPAALVPAAAALAASLVLAGTASAKATTITLTTGPGTAHVGAPWTLTLHVSLHGRPFTPRGYDPELWLANGAGTLVASFRARVVAPGTYRVRVVFPHAGSWRYVVPDPLLGEWVFAARVAA